MHKKIVLVSFVSLLLIAPPHIKAQGMLDTSLDSTDTVSSSADNGSISSVDAQGNMTIKSNEDYTSSVDLSHGNLTLGSGATITKSVRVRNGNVILEKNSEISGSVTVDNGNLLMEDNATIGGSVTVGGTLTVKDNADITGPVSVTSSGVITVGSNADIKGTLTSAAGLKVGSNSDIKLFLSGKSVEIDGKVYKLGGTILASGANTSVGLPFVPKPKTGTAVATTSTAAVSQEEIEQPVASVTAPETASGETSAFEFPDVSNIMNESDITAYVSDVISKNTNVHNLDLSSEAVNLDYQAPASLFGFIPMTVPAHVSVSKDKAVDVSYPWYSFLMSTNKQAIQDAVSKSVENTLTSSGETTNGFSAKLQATVANSILSAFKNLF